MAEELNFEISDALGDFIKSCKKGKHQHNLQILRQAVGKISKENLNRTQKNILEDFLYFQIYKIEAEISKNKAQKVTALKNARAHARSENEINEIEIALALREAEKILDKQDSKSPVEIVSELKVLVNKIDQHGGSKNAGFLRGMAAVYEAGELAVQNKRPESLEKIVEAAQILKKNDFQDGYYKFMSLKCRVEAKYQPSPVEALKLMQQSKRWIQKTSDKHGLNECEADILWLKSIVETHQKKKAEYLEGAGKLYLTTDQKEKGHELLGHAYKIKSNFPNLDIKETLKLKKKSFEEFEKAGKFYKRLYHNAKGGYYGTLAVVRGILESKEKLFVKYAITAVQEFEKAKNYREADFFVGQLALKFGTFAQAFDKKVEHLDVAVNALAQVNLPLSKFAEFQLYNALAANELDTAVRKDLLKKSVSALRIYLDYIDKNGSHSDRTKVYVEKGESAILLLKADMHRICSEIAPNKTVRAQEAKEAIVYLEKIKDRNDLPPENLAVNFAMTYISSGDYDRAVSVLEKELARKPNNKKLQHLTAYSKELLVTGYRKFKEEAETLIEFEEKKVDLGVTFTSPVTEFVPSVLRLICKKGFQLEEMPRSQKKKNENELRDELLLGLQVDFGGDATAESLVGDGKTDIRVKNPLDSRDVFITECKNWSGAKAYVDAKKQLFRYLPPQQNYGAIVTFVKEKDFNKIYETALATTESMDDYYENSIQNWPIIKRGRDFFFISKHKSNKGGEVVVYHIFFHLA